MDMHSPANVVHNNSMSSLESTFQESLHIRDDRKSEHACPGDANCDVEEGDLSEDIKYLQTNPNKKCFKKCATFPSKMMMPASSLDEEVVEADASSTEHCGHSHSISLRTPLEHVSAIKGSREKQVGSRMKLTVKWAPDVYDPVPTSLSHTVDKSKKQHKHRNKKPEKKNGKKSRKGNSSRGGSGKDKRQIRKMAWSSSDLFYGSLDYKVIAASTEPDVLDVASHDSYCGTSFLRNSVTQLHFSVAEAQ